MSRRKTSKNPALHPLGSPQSTDYGFRVFSKNAVLEITALAPDLFRLRVQPGRRIADRPSWAVTLQSRSVDCSVHHGKKQSVLRTQMASFQVDRDTGAWKFRNDLNAVDLVAKSGGTRIAKKEAELSLQLQPADAVHGLGETTGTFDKRGLIREFWNTDVLGHAPCMHASMRSLYVSIPFGILLRDGFAVGIFWDQPRRQTWDIGQTHRDEWRLQSCHNEIDIYLFAGPSIQDVVRAYSRLTGTMELPPRWAIGFHQCRYSYESRSEVEKVADSMRRKKIPCDVLYFDIHHMNGYRVFTFGKTYPRPAQLIRSFAKKGFKVVTIVDPGVKDDPKFGVLKRGKKSDAFVKDRHGKKDFIGAVWPGRSRFPDFLNQKVRQWWGDEQDALSKLGVAGFWNDMNEPANFALPSKTLDERARHHSDFGPMRHAEAHNLYGMQMARASRDGALRSHPNRRPFVITRAAYAGIQRYSMVWTGDNSSTWEHLNDSIQMLLNLSLSGAPFCGCDAGGFLDNATPELYLRWMQMAAFTPFFRGHTNFQTLPHEPWSFGRDVEELVQYYVQLRYSLMPMLYSLFAEASRDGTPIMRPLFWHYPGDPDAVRCSDEFLLGRDLLVAPIVRAGAVARMVYLPAGDWYHFYTGQKLNGSQYLVMEAGELLPLFVRAGATIPMFPSGALHVEQQKDSKVQWHHFTGGMSDSTCYDDDGESLDYQKGRFSQCRVSSASSDMEGRIVATPQTNEGYPLRTVDKLVIYGLPSKPSVTVNGKRAKAQYNRSAGVADVPLQGAATNIEIRWKCSRRR